MKSNVFIAVTVDGFIAREDGNIDWLSSFEGTSGQDYGYLEFFRTIDAIVMGRNTFEEVLSFGVWPYKKTPVFVLSNQNIEIPKDLSDSVSLMRGSPQDIFRRLEEKGYKNLYIDGGKTIQGFLREGLIDQLIITRIPILIGKGISLFGLLERDIQLSHIGTIDFDNGIVQDKYEILEK
ncbi:MAG TPA: dihydrofolate reductase family protein [Pelolinea sp.]|nr:dihydrofolate reductase family protein [Pelolinea sp.]